MYVHTILGGTLYKSIQQVGCYVLVRGWQWLKATARLAVAPSPRDTAYKLKQTPHLELHLTALWKHLWSVCVCLTLFQRQESFSTCSIRLSYSPTSASSTQCQLHAGPWNIRGQFETHCVRECVRLSVRSFLTIHLSKPLWHDTLSP